MRTACLANHQLLKVAHAISIPFTFFTQGATCASCLGESKGSFKAGVLTIDIFDPVLKVIGHSS